MSTPRRIEYTGPEGWTVWADEDGVHVRTPGQHGLESPDLDRLIALVGEVKKHMATGIPTPRPPSPEERRSMFGIQREEYDAKRAAKAVHKALAPITDHQPF